MGQFKPMVKMETTEPSVELKLKKGGEVKMQMGGAAPMRRMADMPSMPARGGSMPAAAPGRPSLAARRRAMMEMPSAAAPAGPVGRAGRMMKEGGESKAEHKAEKAKMTKTEQKLKEHAAKPASKAHKGLKTGGVVDGQGGYKKGGSVHTTKVDTAKPDHSPAKTGDVKMGNGGGYKTGGVAKANAGGYKEGGAPKKAYATGGRVDSGRPVAMPQGRKAPPKPVSINRLSGTYKKGGEVMKEGGIPDDIKSQMQQAENERAYEAYERNRDQENLDTKKSVDDFLMAIPRGIKRMFSRTPKGEAVTETEKSVTVERAKKAGGGVC